MALSTQPDVRKWALSERRGSRLAPVSGTFPTFFSCARRKVLRDKFSKVADAVVPLGVKIDFDSVSVSAQTVDAEIPVEKLETVTAALQKDDVRTDVLERRRAIEG